MCDCVSDCILVYIVTGKQKGDTSTWLLYAAMVPIQNVRSMRHCVSYCIKVSFICCAVTMIFTSMLRPWWREMLNLKWTAGGAEPLLIYKGRGKLEIKPFYSHRWYFIPLLSPGRDLRLF